jgi:hypothetical protein
VKKILIIVVIAAVLAGLILAIGCTSPASKAQKMYNEGKYEEVIVKYGSDPSMAAIVTQAKEKLAEKMVTEGKYEAVIQMYPETAAAGEARNKLAEQLFLAKKYDEVIAKYPETTWAAQARAEKDKISQGGGGGGGGTKPGGGGVSADTEKAAQAELDGILKVKVPDLKKKALREFIADPKHAGTQAVTKAQTELGKMS